MNVTSLIEAIGLTKIHRAGQVEIAALQGANLRIGTGESVAILGPSGSGKSTLLGLIGCLDRPTAGRYLLDGMDVSRAGTNRLAEIRNRKIGFVFQGFNLLARATAVENVELPLLYSGAEHTRSQRRRMALRALERVGLGARARHLPHQLAGGEQQRVAIARAIVNDPAVLLADEPTGNLDSRTGAGIMEIFRELNREGMTLVIVTHDPEIAGFCSRRIVVRDGVILSDTVDPERLEREPLAGGRAGRAAGGRRRSVGLLGSVRTSLRELGRNRLRSSLTALGIIIGVGAIITMVSIGRGATAQVAEQVAGLGENLIMVERGSSKNWIGVRGGKGTANVLNVDDAEAVAGEVPGVAAVSPEVYAYEQVTAGSRNWKSKIYGEDTSYFTMRRWRAAAGELFSDAHVQGAALVAVIGPTTAEELFEDEDPIGQSIRIRRIPFRVIGLLSPKGTSVTGRDEDDIIFIPYTTHLRRVLGSGSELHRINVQAADASRLSSAKEAILELLHERYRLPPGSEDEFFEIESQIEIEELATDTSRTMTLLLGSVAGVSLLVGGVGIMNIMFVSVSERTREIGIRIAVGARRADVLRQFLIEALTLSSSGGSLGIALGLAGSYAVSTLARWPTMVPADAVLVAFVFSAGVGVFFGFYPAMRASRLDPIVALRYE